MYTFSSVGHLPPSASSLHPQLARNIGHVPFDGRCGNTKGVCNLSIGPTTLMQCENFLLTAGQSLSIRQRKYAIRDML
jgi:hypothetical protein